MVQAQTQLVEEIEASLKQAPLLLGLGLAVPGSHLAGANRRLAGTFHPRSGLLAHIATRRPLEASKGRFPQDTAFLHCTWQTLPDFTLPLVHASLGIFESLQAEWTAQAPESLVKASQLYLEALRAQLTRLSPQEQSLLVQSHAVWHIMDVMLLSDRPVAECLTEWVTTHIPFPPPSLISNIHGYVTPHLHAEYWKTVTRTLVRGQWFYTSSLLGLHPSCSEGPLKALLDMLDQVPASGNASAWKSWSQAAEYYRTPGLLRSLMAQPADAQALDTLFAILNGDVEVILQVSERWEDALTGVVLFGTPGTTRPRVRDALETVTASFPLTSTLDQAVGAFLSLDVHRALRLCAKLNWWLVSHLADVVYKTGRLDKDEALALSGLTDTVTLREWFLLEYANLLFSHPSLWLEALTVLVYCPVRGPEVMRDLVLRVPLDSPRVVDKVLSFCRRHQLHEESKSIHITLGMAALGRERYGDALYHFMEANALTHIEAVCERVLDVYLSTGSLPFDNVTGSLGPHALYISDRLAFVARYAEFHDLYAKEEWKEAGRALLLLLSSESAPKRFWKTLLVDAIPLLERADPVFSVDDTCEILRCLELLISAHNHQELLLLPNHQASGHSHRDRGHPDKHRLKDKAESMAAVDETLDVLRLAAVRNLARGLASKQQE